MWQLMLTWMCDQFGPQGDCNVMMMMMMMIMMMMMMGFILISILMIIINLPLNATLCK